MRSLVSFMSPTSIRGERVSNFLTKISPPFWSLQNLSNFSNPPMKTNQKETENFSWSYAKVTLSFLLLISLSYISYSLKLLQPYICKPLHFQSHSSISNPTPPNIPIPPSQTPPKTNISHIVFGIAASADLWPQRKSYIKLWWKPRLMRGHVWLDQNIESQSDDALLPRFKISSDTSGFQYTYPNGQRSAIRIARIVAESLRLNMKNVRWFVLGDDDTVFVPENLVRVLGKYDHNQFYYVGGSSESHLQNIRFSYNMAYGGGGIAISIALAKELERMLDRCIQRYPELYGSDDRLQACMAEIGVPLTREKGFHQFDVYGSLFGLLAAHPVAPLVSLHHLDLVQPIFPNMTRIQALQRLKLSAKLDSAALAQQSICYDAERSWTVSISWGYSVQILRGISPAREMELPARTFVNWYKNGDTTSYPFNTAAVSGDPCREPFVYYLSSAIYDRAINQTRTEYVIYKTRMPGCKWKMANPARIRKVVVLKSPDPNLWDKSPRRNCCRVSREDIRKKKKGSTMVVEVGVCREDEVVEIS